jgi:hypothetical protein
MVEALRSRAVIEQAKGIVMLRYDMDEDSAFRVLVRWSSVHNVKLRTVATTMVQMAVTSLDVGPSDASDDPGLRTAIRHVLSGFDEVAQHP